MRDQVSVSGAEARARSNAAVQRASVSVSNVAASAEPGATVIAPDPGLWGAAAARSLETPVGGWLKRTFDIAVASAAVLMLAPLLALIWIAVRLEQRGEAIFKQHRGGLGGRVFEIYKFRSMTCAEDGAAVRQVQAGDQRITPLGGFLRQTSWDELPQLFNVIRGDMSLIGPRPHAIEHDRAFSAIDTSYQLRFRARPGITGLAQVSGCRGPTETEEKVRARVAFDVQYVTAWSLLADLHILVRTLMLATKRDPGAI